jgi:hypothetical protein
LEEAAKSPEEKLFDNFRQEIRTAYNGKFDHPNVKLAISFFDHFNLPRMAMNFVKNGERKNPLKPEKFKLWIQEVKSTEYADDIAFAELLEFHFIDYENLFNVFVKNERKAKIERDRFSDQGNVIQAAFRASLKI